MSVWPAVEAAKRRRPLQLRKKEAAAFVKAVSEREGGREGGREKGVGEKDMSVCHV